MPAPVKSRRYRLIFWPLFSAFVVYVLTAEPTSPLVVTFLVIPGTSGLAVWAAIFIAQRAARNRANKSLYVTPIAQTDLTAHDILNK